VKLQIGTVRETDRLVPGLVSRVILRTAVLLAIIGWMSGAVDAQAASGRQPEAKPDPQLKISPLETLRNFEPASDEECRLGCGDEIIVDLVGRADLTAKLVVGPDGRITLPLAGDLMLAGKTREQAAKGIDAALLSYYTNLAAAVTVTRYMANKVLVLGAVERPGVHTFDAAPTLVEAVSRSGHQTGPNKASRIPECCAYQVAPAVAPLTLGKSGVLLNTFMIALAGLFFGVLAAVMAHKVDPKIYIAADVERVLGFAPLAQLPNFNEVSEDVAEEYMLRLASAIEHGRKQGSLRNCIFTGTGPGTGVSTLVNRVRAMLEAIGCTTILVDAAGARPPVQHSSADPKGADSGSPERALHLVPGGRAARPAALERMAEETGTEEDSLVLTDTAPLSVSAETEYLARFVDCAIVVIESGVTTRDELRKTAQTLQRLNIGTVGFVLNRVALAKADPAFRPSVEAVETHLRAQGASASRRQEPSSPSGFEEPVGENPAPSRATSPRSLFEPEVAAAAAAVARFSAPPAQKPGSRPAVCLPSLPMGPIPVAQAVRRFSLPFSTELAAESGEPIAVPPIDEPAAPGPPSPASSLPGAAEPAVTKAAPDPQPDPLLMPVDLRPRSQEQEPPAAIADPPVRVAEDNPLAPFPGPAEDIAIAAGLPTDPLSSSHPIAATVPSSTSTPVQENSAPAIAVRANLPMSATGPKETIRARSSIGDKFAVPKEPPGIAEPPIAPDQVIAPEPAKDPRPDPAAVGPAPDPPWWLSDRPHNPEPVRPPVLWQPARMRTSNPAFARPAIGNAPNSRTSAIAAAQKSDSHSDSDSAPTDRDSRLSGLRNLLFVLGLKNPRSGEESPPQPATSGPKTDPEPIVGAERSIAEDDPPTAAAASPRLATEPPEVLPPRPVVIEFDQLEERPGESSRPDRCPPDDRIATLPSKRGQYKKS
jgi:hypothetical protein